MPVDAAVHGANAAATGRMRAMARLTDAELATPVGEHWTVAVALAHLAFWDRRVLLVLEGTERAGAVEAREIDISVNDVTLPAWSAIPPRDTVRLAIESAETLDARLAAYPAELLAAVEATNARWVRRSIHRNLHLDEVEAALDR